MVCAWCRQEIGLSGIFHVCADGSTASDRIRYFAAGLTSPALLPPARVTKKYDSRMQHEIDEEDRHAEGILNAYDDNFLSALKIRWRKDDPNKSSK